MAKQKHFPKFQTVQKSHHSVPKKILRARHEQCYVTAKKILRHFELKPELLEVFTKRQKEQLFKVFYIKPVVKPERERTVPRLYIRNINTDVYQFLKNNYWGNPENNISLAELATYGLSFLSNIEQAYEEKFFEENSPQYEAARTICAKFNRDEVLNNEFSGLMTDIYHQTSGYSKVNFRMYGFSFDCEKIPRPCGCCNEYRFAVIITAKDSESKIFTHQEIKRKAFRMYQTEIGRYVPGPATVERNKIFPKAKENDEMNIYIQSHVLHRFKERIDIFAPTVLNILILSSFTINMELTPFENRVLFACLVDKQPVGYFTFFVQDSDIVINTFLPLTSVGTPEGRKLQEILSLTKEDINYLGMDKISFYVHVDFEQIPLLKQALIDSNIWPTKLVLDEQGSVDGDDESLIDLNKTNFVKNFFEKYKRHRIITP